MPYANQTTIEAEPGEQSSRQLFFAVFPSIMLPMFLAAIDQTIVATALPAMAGALGDVERISWVVVSYLVATTIAAPVYGRLGDILGRRRLLFVALAIFIVASVLCAIASSIAMLTFARVLQGLGGGGLMTLSQALVGEAVPPRERGRYQGYLASVFVCSSTFGPVAGGWLTQHFGWESVFLVNVPVGFAAIAMAFRLPRRTATAGRMHFDFVGLVLFTLFIAPTLLALEQVQRFDLRALPMMLLLVAIAGASLVLLLRQERRVATPLLPVTLLRQSTIWRADAMAACVGASLVSMITFLPIYLQVVRSTTPGDTGLLMLPLTAFIAFGSLFTGRMVTKTGRTALFPSLGLPVVAAALVVLALFAPQMTLYQLPWLFAVIALTNGTAMPVVQTTVQMLAGPKQLGAAAASVQFSRSIGAAVGTALTGAVLFAVLAANDLETARLFGHIVEEGPKALAGMSAERIAVVQSEIAGAFRAAFLTIACFSGIGALLAWSMPVRRIT
ncbi:MFS transporter [Limobrevibacterium gyesilva]|uniref:MFS transporter n=1 Tax=Limobrevibacterium gyesilva TaxID=2991712 RepID=A0AA41YLX7_9PROT|nr:MFS transporter [Limobrevibacterium gyesilva]MCW3475899.1 MFS transporter [Limobrevibacterium gyesilva]